jgi:hypothetical protein
LWDVKLSGKKLIHFLPLLNYSTMVLIPRSSKC